jgi:toxoflavin biosynthesis protein ToxD
MVSDPQVPELIEIYEGVFVLGDDYGPRSAQPAHEITLPTYYISRYPVTMLDYAAYLRTTNRSAPTFWPNPTRWLEQANLPVAGVMWRDALGYCSWLSRQIGKVVRLPSEAEWEKAALWSTATNSKRLYPFGDEFDPACANSAESLIGALTPVDTYRLIGDSAYGVTDMFGNAAEWTLARYLPYPYEVSGGRHDLNLMDYKVVRSGSFQTEARWTTAVHRQYFSPDESRYPIGFRIVIEV